jgi:hypothetical protein
MIERGGNKTGDAALHIDRAASVKLGAGDFTAERRVPPRRFIAGRHHVGMPGEDQVRPLAADTGIKVIDRRRARLSEGGAMNGKTRWREYLLQISKRATVFGGYRSAADKIAGNGDGIGDHTPSFASPVSRAQLGFFERVWPLSIRPARADCRRDHFEDERDGVRASKGLARYATFAKIVPTSWE